MQKKANLKQQAHVYVGGIRHLLDRMRDRAISIAEINQLRLWIESNENLTAAERCGLLRS